MNANTTKNHAKNQKKPRKSNAILFQHTIICSKTAKGTLEQCVDEVDPTFLSPKSTDHFLLSISPQNVNRTCNKC